MKIQRVTSIAAAIALAASPSLAAQGDVYTCVFDNIGSQPIAEEVLIAHPDGTQTYTVIDALIQHFVGQPVDAKVTRNTDKRLDLRWELPLQLGLQDTKKLVEARTVYQLAFVRKTGKATILANPLRFANKWSATGKCKVTRGNI